MKKITAYTIHTTAEGERAAFTYSVIDEEGNITASNKRAEIILLDDNILNADKIIKDFLQAKIPE